ncbi:hypothetical protein M9Y10_028926 [Tritrichomonas musculus]|uniref:Thioredoxin domain-containing protein n=1 Tax=Tritrichomonas musculus TaxID=1915356 RepID=A0ABR2KLK3_9EUKA
MLTVFLFFLSVIFHPDESNFKYIMQSSSEMPLFVIYTMDGSDPSRRLMKRWKSIEEIYSKNKTVLLADISCSSHKKVCRDYLIKFCPLIRCYLPGDQHIDYIGPREQNDMLIWINQMLTFPVINESDYSSYISNESVTFVLHNESFYSDYKRIAYIYKNTTNIFINSPKKSDNEELVAYFGNSIKKVFDIKKDLSYSNFIWKHQFPIGFELTRFNYNEASHNGRYLAILLLNPAMPHKRRTIRAFKNASKNFEEKFVFCIMDAITYGNFLDTLKIDKLPSIVIIDEPKERHYIASVDQEVLQAELEGIVNGTIQFHHYSRFKKTAFFAKNFIKDRWPVLFITLIMFSLLIFGVYLFVVNLKSMMNEGFSFIDCFRPVKLPSKPKCE